MSDIEPVEISTRMRPGEWSEETLEALVADYQAKIRDMGAGQADVETHVDRDEHGGVSVKVIWTKDQVIDDPLP